MLFQMGINMILIIAAVVLFVMVKNTIARICLVVGGVLLIAIVNIAFDRLFQKKDERGNVITVPENTFLNRVLYKGIGQKKSKADHVKIW